MLLGIFPLLGVTIHATDAEPQPLSCIAPWEPHAAVAVSIPVNAVLHQDALLQIYTDLAAVVTQYCDLLVCYSYRERDELPTLMQHFQQDVRIEKRPYRIEYVDSEINSPWIRDFGPIFARDPDGSVVLFNNRYEILSNEADDLEKKDARTLTPYEMQMLEKARAEKQSMRENSMTNGYLAKQLHYLYGMDISVEKTGMLLDGGDFMYAGNGKLITGEAGILYGDISKRELTEKLKKTFGLSEVHFLPNLPGMAATHLDMNLMVIDEHHIIVSEVPRRMQNQRIYMDYMYEQLEKHHAHTTKYLKSHFPDMQMHLVPALPVIADTQERVVNKLWNRIFAKVGDQIGVMWGSLEFRPANDKQRIAAETMIVNEISLRVGMIKPWGQEGLDKVMDFYFGSSFAQEDLIHAERMTYYRSYTNSLFIRSTSGEEVILLPRYKPRTPMERELVPEFETQVEAAYHAARPQAKLEWIDVDAMIDRQGAIHCFATTIPMVSEQ